MVTNHARVGTPDAVFRALADPTRRAILDSLRRGAEPAGRIAARFEITRPAVSRHLKVLRSAGLVQERRAGRHRIYALQPAPLRHVDRWLEEYRRFWPARLARLKRHVEAHP
ncbi:MAG: ArsR/SmtB family transcription factor [Gemmatimonadota bacterium]